MSFGDAVRFRLRTLLRQRDFARELDEEMRFHLALEAAQREHAGRGALSPTDARSGARRQFGNVTTHTEEARRMAGLGFLDAARQDVRFALRSFRRTPGFTAVVVLTLAIGIGANTAIFSAVNALLLRPLPFAEPERLMQVSLTSPARGDAPAREDRIWSYPKLVVFRDAQRVFQYVTAYSAEGHYAVRGDDGAERLLAEQTDSRYLPTLGIRPALGRNFTAEEDRQPGGPKVVLISHALWERRFGGDSAVLGGVLHLNGAPYSIIGVLPRGFRGLSGRAELWVPILASRAEMLNQPWSHSYNVIGRLRPGVSPEQASVVVRELGRRVDAAYPHPEIADEHWGAAARPLDATRVDPLVRRSLLVLLGAVGLVLLIACANVANLSLVRATGREREIAVRLAVGAGRGRLVRQLLTESLLLAALGGLVSVMVAWWGVRGLATLDAASALRVRRLDGLGVLGFDAIRLDVRALAFAGTLVLVTGVLFGLVPALRATRPSLAGAPTGDALRAPGGGRGTTGGRHLLAAAQIALALVLLAGSGLMLRSLGRLIEVDPGVRAENVLMLRLRQPIGFARDSLPHLYDELLARLSTLPGVTRVALGDCPPLNGGCSGTILLRHDRPRAAPGTEPSVGVHWATPEWFAALGVPLLRGRLFTSADRRNGRRVVLVSETAARRIWPGEDPIGRPVGVGQGGFLDDTAYVVGVVGDVRYATLDAIPRSDVYLSYLQAPFSLMTVFVRTSGDPLALSGAVRAAVRGVAPDAPIYDMRTLEAHMRDATAPERFGALLLTLFAAMALALAAIGIYGVIAFAVSQRTREIGVRIALGATRGDVVRLVVGQGLGIAAAGVMAGLLLALATTRVLRSLLYDVTPTDPGTFVAIVALLMGAVVAASWRPAWRAASIPPTRALGAE